MQATKLTSSDRTAIEVSLARLVGDAFGSLATLPLYCTDQLPSADPRSIVLDHFDVWRSCLIVIREVLKSEGFSTDEMPRGVGELMSELTRLGGAYLAIQATQKDMPKKAVEAFELLESAYRRIPQLVRELGTELEVDTPFLPAERSLKRETYERSLRALADFLAGRASGDAVRP